MRAAMCGLFDKQMRLFISHIHEEGAVALAVKDQLQFCFGEQVGIILAQDIPLGTNWLNWLKEIQNALKKAEMVLVLFPKT